MSDLFAVPWHRGTLTAYDTETTSPDPHTARIVTCTIATINGSQVDPKMWLINPGIDIPDEAAAIHGVTTEVARRDGADPADALAEIAQSIGHAIAMGRTLVAYNASFDTTLLRAEFDRHGIDCPLGDASIVDPFVIDKHLDRFRKGRRTLTACCEHYGVRLDGAHDATQDALAAARLAWVMAERHPELQIDPAELHGRQIVWKREQAESFGQYLRRQGKTDDVSRSWPIQEAPQAVAS